MSALGRHVAEYLALRRSFGFKLEREEQLLTSFVEYSESAGAKNLSSELAIAWAKLPAAASANQWAKRLGVVRSFAVYLVTIDPATEVPPSGIFPTDRRRPSPYLFSETDIERVLAAARGLAPPLRAATHEALFGLLAVSGMRIGEAIGLARGDVDLESGVITIRHAKFDRTRFVPLHESTTAALSAYAATRDRLCRRPRTDVFFCSSVGTTLDRSGVDKTFRQITTALGLRTATTHPRVHDLRHVLSALCACSDSPGKRTYRPSPPTQLPPRCRFSSPKRTLSSCTRLDRDKMQHEHHRTRRVRTEVTPSP